MNGRRPDSELPGPRVFHVAAASRGAQGLTAAALTGLAARTLEPRVR